MTFEEFFNKKRIDLGALKRAQPALYDEFRQHYERMGEKSFDHTKKYWFNRLRKDYLLKEPIVAETKPKTVATASDAPTTSGRTPAAAPPKGFKPRFKAGAVKPPQPATAEPQAAPSTPTDSTEDTPKPEENTPATPTTATKPLGFKPRFKAGAVKPSKPATAEPQAAPSAPTDSTEDTPKPEENTPAAPTTATKPLGFKPRFKAGVTNKKKDQE